VVVRLQRVNKRRQWTMSRTLPQFVIVRKTIFRVFMSFRNPPSSKINYTLQLILSTNISVEEAGTSGNAVNSCTEIVRLDLSETNSVLCLISFFQSFVENFRMVQHNTPRLLNFSSFVIHLTSNNTTVYSQL